MATNKILLDQAFRDFWQKIEQRKNFAIVRYGDGEYKIMQGVFVKAQEGWVAPNHITKLSTALHASLAVMDSNFHYAISCPCCDQAAYYWYSSRIQNNNITFANLFVNKNFIDFEKRFSKLERDAVVIANHKGINKRIGSLNIIKYYSVSDNCVKFWEENGENLIEKIASEFKNKKNLLFLVAAGPLSGPIIANLFQKNPDNCYIDVGSAVDFYIHDKITRSYQKRNSKYAQKNCWMFDPSDTKFDISVVVNLYKRPECLEKQLQALENQTLKPTKIMLFHDAVASGEPITLPSMLKDKFDIIEVATKNTGVWGRFKFAKQAKTNYVCVFDDDTIPGNRWLESCHYQMQHQEGLYGANGVIMINPEEYPLNFISFGWKNPNKKLLAVDFVGHSWFFKTKWLDSLFQAPKSIQELKICGEDMSFSYQLQKVLNLPTYVPPHPSRKYDLYGSLPGYARKFGSTKVALSACKHNTTLYNKAINILLQQDYKWQTVLQNKQASLKRICLMHKIIKSICGAIPFSNFRRIARASLLMRLLQKTKN